MPSSYDWLQRMLVDVASPSEADIRNLVADCPAEDGFVEYKAAPWVLDPRAARELREYVAAFANVSGGVILLGYQKDKQLFADVKAPGRAALEDWIAEATAPLRAYFHFGPRLRIVQMAEGVVAIIAIPRSLSLVSIADGHRNRYPVRWGATNQDLPEELALDIRLGRRRNPYLRARLARVTYKRVDVEVGTLGASGLVLGIHIQVENAGLVFAEGVRAGLVGWAVQAVLAPDSLRASVDAEEPYAEHWRAKWQLGHCRNERDQGVGGFRGGLELAPFDVADEKIPVAYVARFPDHSSAARDGDARWRGEIRGRVSWEAGIYILAKDTEPVWYQFRAAYDAGNTEGPEAVLAGCKIEPVHARPRVAVTFRPFP